MGGPIVNPSSGAALPDWLDFPPERGDRLRTLIARGDHATRRGLRWTVSGMRLAELRAALRGAPPKTTTNAPASGPPVVYLGALPWSYRFQRPQQLARSLAERHPVLYVEAFDRSPFIPR